MTSETSPLYIRTFYRSIQNADRPIAIVTILSTDSIIANI